MKPTVKCPECYSTELYKNGKNKKGNQKYLCKKCRRQFTLKSIKKLNNPKCPACGKGMYLHPKYKYHVSFKCNNRQCNPVSYTHLIETLNRLEDYLDEFKGVVITVSHDRYLDVYKRQLLHL